MIVDDIPKLFVDGKEIECALVWPVMRDICRCGTFNDAVPNGFSQKEIQQS
jgi:hypothetical protein